MNIVYLLRSDLPEHEQSALSKTPRSNSNE